MEKGSLISAGRTAEVFAGGCIMNAEAGTSGRQAVLAWKVDKGTFNGVTLDNLIDFTPGLHAEALAIAARYKTGPLFTPPSEKGTVQVPGHVGGGVVGDVVLDGHQFARMDVERVALGLEGPGPAAVGVEFDGDRHCAIVPHRRRG